MGAPGRFRRIYGANPLHLLVLVACFALVGYVISLLGTEQLWNPNVWWQSIGVWFVGAIVLHDMVLFPVYALADRSLGAGWRAVTGRAPKGTPVVPPVNYIRVPVMATALLFLLFFPGIIRQGKNSYLRATGLTQQPFLDRWLLLTAAFFGVSALLYGVRTVMVRRRRRPPTGPAADQSVGALGSAEPEAE
jgi:hypothetical protein